MKPTLLFVVLLASVAALPQAAPPAGDPGFTQPTWPTVDGLLGHSTGNTPLPPKMMADWPQLKRLRAKQKRFIDASIKLNNAMKALLDECQRTVAENNWPADTTCDLRDLTFTPATTHSSPPRE